MSEEDKDKDAGGPEVTGSLSGIVTNALNKAFSQNELKAKGLVKIYTADALAGKDDDEILEIGSQVRDDTSEAKHIVYYRHAHHIEAPVLAVENYLDAMDVTMVDDPSKLVDLLKQS